MPLVMQAAPVLCVRTIGTPGSLGRQGLSAHANEVRGAHPAAREVLATPAAHEPSSRIALGAAAGHEVRKPEI